ncbi:MAG: hypothetical protein QXH07_06300 [Thermoplasmata archaeon]
MTVIYNEEDNKTFGRKRNRWFREANELTRVYHTLIYQAEGSLYDRFFKRREISQDIVFCARNYHEAVQNRYIWLKGEKDNGERYHYFIEYTERFQKKYIKQQIIKLNRAFKGLEIKKNMFFVTLTIDPSLFYSIYDSYKESQKNVNSLLTLLRKRYGSTFRYIKVAEIQEENTKNIHYHLVISLRSDVMEWNIVSEKEFREIIKKYWKIGFSDIQLVKETKKNGLKHYVMKYLFKSMLSKTNSISENHAILWALNARIFSFTNIKRWREQNDLITAEGGKNNSNEELDPDDNIIWEYMGLVDHQNLGIMPGLYAEKNLSAEVLTFLYNSMYYKNNDNG